MTLEDVFNRWIVDKRRQVKESSLSNYYFSCKKNILPYFGKVDVENIDKHMVREFAYEQLESKAPKTVKDIIMVLKMLMKYAAEEYDIAVHSLVWKIVWPSDNLERHKIERYTPKETKAILEYASANPSNMSLGLIIAITTGMRIGEICALRFSDVDLDKDVIHVTKTVSRVGRTTDMDAASNNKRTKIVETTPKTKCSQRDVPIVPQLKKLLKAYMAISRPDYYIISGNRRACEPHCLRSNAARLVLRSGLDHSLRFHAFRHTFASTLIEQKIDPKTVSSILGHADVSITLDLYVHPSDENKKNAISKGFKGIL